MSISDYSTQELADLHGAVDAAANGKPVQYRDADLPDAEWFDSQGSPSWAFRLRVYRAKPEPVEVPWTAKDVPPLCWLRGKSGSGINNVQRMVLCVQDLAIVVFPNETVVWRNLDKWEHSTDRISWHPCTVQP